MAVDYFPLNGGLDLVTPSIAVVSGHALVLDNYEVDLYGGYRRISGYERFDGHGSPTDVGAGVPANIEAQRALIGAVPGSGIIRGVWVYAGNVYAFRDNVAGSACVMFKSTVTGWVIVTTPALIAGGRYEFVNYNFTGSNSTNMMFGSDGVNKAFQFDGTTFTQIITGMTTDAPKYIAAHKKHLFLSFLGGSVQHSSIGDPLTWSPVLGAAELAIGDECTGFEQQTGDVLAIFARNHTHMLYGTSSADWNLRPFSRTTGCIPYTNQRIGNMTYYLDDRGVTSLMATQAFGDFIADSISQPITPIITGMKPFITSSVQIRDKGQYRLFTSDGRAVCATFSGNTMSGWSTIDLPVSVECCVSGETLAGNEVIYFGSSNGFVYQMEKGTSFDGVAVPATIRLHFNHEKSPRVRKRYRRIFIEQEDATLDTPISYKAEFDLGAYTSGQGITQSAALGSPASYWNASSWGQFTWSTDRPTAINGDTPGSAKNIGIVIHSLLTYESAYKLTSAMVHYDLRRAERGD